MEIFVKIFWSKICENLRKNFWRKICENFRNLSKENLWKFEKKFWRKILKKFEEKLLKENLEKIEKIFQEKFLKENFLGKFLGNEKNRSNYLPLPQKVIHRIALVPKSQQFSTIKISLECFHFKLNFQTRNNFFSSSQS